MLNYLESNKKLILLVVFLVSFALRIGFMYQEHSSKGTSYWSDAMLYLRIGQQFAKGDFYPEIGSRDYMIVAPIVPLIVAASEVIFGDPIWPVLIFNCLLTALMVYVLFWIGYRFIGLLAGYFLAFWSVFNFGIIRLNNQILKEPLLFLLIPLIVLCLINVYQKRKELLNTVLSSVLFSVLIHTDERFFVYAPIFLVFIFFAHFPKLKIKLSAIWLVILLVTMVPWTIRNYKQFGELVILSPRTTAFTSKLWGTNYANLHFESEEKMDRDAEYRKNQAEETVEKYGVEPRRYGKHEVYYRAFVHYWKPTYFRSTFIQYGYRHVRWSLSHNANSIVFYGIFLPFYVVGLFMAFKRKNWLIVYFWSLPFLHGLLHTVMIWPLERYRLPMNFLIVLIALWVVDEVWGSGFKVQGFTRILADKNAD